MDLIKVTLHGIGMVKQVQVVNQQLRRQNVVLKINFFNDVDSTIEMVKAVHDDFHADAEIFEHLRTT